MQTALLLLAGTGRIVSWGWNEHGNCGTGTEDDVRVPLPVGIDMKQKTVIVGTGAGHTFALNFWGTFNLTITLLTWRIWRVPTNASKWQMGFNLVFKGLKVHFVIFKDLNASSQGGILLKHNVKWNVLILALNRYSIAVQLCCQSLQMHNIIFGFSFLFEKKIIFLIPDATSRHCRYSSLLLWKHCTVTLNLAEH